MFTLHVLNDAGEWEQIDLLFKTKFSAVQYYVNKLGGSEVWEDYRVTELTAYNAKQHTLAELEKICDD